MEQERYNMIVPVFQLGETTSLRENYIVQTT